TFTANLTDTQGGKTFNVSGWTGGGALSNTYGAADTLTANQGADFTLSNNSLTTSDGMNLTLRRLFRIANLTDTQGGHQFTVGGWTRGGTLTNAGAAGDTVNAVKAAGYTLSPSNLSGTDGMSLALAGKIPVVNLTDTQGGNTFTLNGWI